MDGAMGPSPVPSAQGRQRSEELDVFAKSSMFLPDGEKARTEFLPDGLSLVLNGGGDCAGSCQLFGFDLSTSS
jgi:hypothetical protein